MPSGHCGAVRHEYPFADELLTSWHARQRHSRRGRALPAPKAVRNRKGDWHHPDIRPTRAWLSATADDLNVPATRLVEHSLAKHYPYLPVDFLAWEHPPGSSDSTGLIPVPRLHVRWCSRCLAEDFASDRPAHVRRQWVLAAVGFCHRHRWPLEDRCNGCGSRTWRFAMPARGPLRMICEACWQPLERTSAPAIYAGKDALLCWEHVIAFEQQCMGAIKGRTPDQFRFNFTSADQLLNEVRGICRLLTRKPPTDEYWWCRTRNIPLNDFACDAMTPGYIGLQFYSSDTLNPLATASPLLRRRLLAAACGIIETNPEIGAALFGPDAPSAIERFIARADRGVLDRLLMTDGHWSSAFISQIKAARERMARRFTISKLEAAHRAIRNVFAHASTNEQPEPRDLAGQS